MRWIAVGGQARNVGKTALVEALLRRFGSWEWAAAKITLDDHGLGDTNNQGSGGEFLLTEEKDAGGETDTARFLAAGARRAFWLQVREERLPEAFSHLLKELNEIPFVIVESNSVVELQRPDLYLMVVDPSVEDLKESARRHLDRVDAFVLSGEQSDLVTWKPPLQIADREMPVFKFSLKQPLSEAFFQFALECLTPNSSKRTAESKRTE